MWGHFVPLVTALISVSNKVNHIAGGKTFWIFNVFKSQERLGIPVEETKCKNRESCQQEIMFVKWEKRRMPFLSCEISFHNTFYFFSFSFMLHSTQSNWKCKLRFLAFIKHQSVCKYDMLQWKVVSISNIRVEHFSLYDTCDK